MYLKLTCAFNILTLTDASSTSTFRKMTFLFSGNAASACKQKQIPLSVHFDGDFRSVSVLMFKKRFYRMTCCELLYPVLQRAAPYSLYCSKEPG